MIESKEHNDIEEKIDQYVNGQLSKPEIEKLWIELIQDEYHLDYLKSVANLKEVITKKRKTKEAVKVRKYWSYSAAAVIVLLVTVLSVFNIPGLDSSASVEPITSIELDYYRSVDGTNADDKRIISEAIALANTGKFNEAVSLLNSELEKASSIEWKSELNLNLGSLYYNDGSYQKSTEYFQNVINHKEAVDVLVLEKAYWYLGNAYFQLDRLTEARQNIQSAYDLNGAYRRVAKSYLDALATAK